MIDCRERSMIDQQIKRNTPNPTDDGILINGRRQLGDFDDDVDAAAGLPEVALEHRGVRTVFEAAVIAARGDSTLSTIGVAHLHFDGAGRVVAADDTAPAIHQLRQADGEVREAVW